MPADGDSPFRRSMDKEEGRSRGAGNPAEIGDDDEGNRCAHEYRENVRSDGATTGSDIDVFRTQTP